VKPFTVIDLGTGPRVYGIHHPAAIERDIFMWSGTSWDLIGDVAGQRVYTLLKYDDGSGPAMYAFGDFIGISGVPARGLAKWNGLTWAGAWSEPVLPHVAYAIHDDGSGPAIYFAGSIGTSENQGIWRFDGHSMTNIGGPQHASPTAPISIDAFASFDDGFGPALFVGGNFPLVNGMPIKNITKFQNGTWHPIGSGVVGELMNLVGLNDVRGPSLFALSTAGGMTGAGGGTVSGTAQWVGCPNCYANCDLSTQAPTLNVADFICFINKYAAKDPYANCTVDAAIDINDFNCFLNKFAAGCP
jgi:hypothetical protein